MGALYVKTEKGFERIRGGGGGTCDGVKTVNGIEPDANGNVEIEVPEGTGVSWNDLTDKPFYEENVTEVLLEEQTFTSALDDSYGYCYGISNVPFALAVGKTYSIIWGGKEYRCEAKDGNADMAGLVYVSDNETFAISVYGTYLMISCLADTSPTEHTVVIYQDTTVVHKLDKKFMPDASSEAVILEEQDIIIEEETEFETEALNPVVAGEIYTVIWNGEEYSCVAFIPPDELGAPEGVLAIGNKEYYEAMASGSSVSLVEPFLIQYFPASVTGNVDMLVVSCVSENCASDVHTVGIYQIVEDKYATQSYVQTYVEQYISAALGGKF